MKLAAVVTADFPALTASFAAVTQSIDSHVNFAFFTSGFFAHLYVPPLVLVVAPDFLHATPLEILVAASAGTAIITPPATMSATEIEAILRSMKGPFVVLVAILPTEH